MVKTRAARLLAWDQPGSVLWEKGEKNRRWREKGFGEQNGLGRRKGGGPRFLLFFHTAEPSPRLLAYENRLSRATSRARLRE